MVFRPENLARGVQRPAAATRRPARPGQAGGGDAVVPDLAALLESMQDGLAAVVPTGMGGDGSGDWH